MNSAAANKDGVGINETTSLLSLTGSEKKNAVSGSTTSASTSPSSVSSHTNTDATGQKNQGRLLLILVAFLYGSLSVSLRMVYARPGPPAASILSAARGWMTVVCLLPIAVMTGRRNALSYTNSSGLPTITADPATAKSVPSSCSKVSFYWFAFELAVFNFGTQGLLNIGLLTTKSARSAFFTQLSVVLTPILTAAVAALRRESIVVKPRVWIACFVALFGLYVLSSSSSSDNSSGHDEGSSGLQLTLSPGDWCCLGSAFSWSYYIYRLSDWGDRYDESQTMLVKNIFMALLYSAWTLLSFLRNYSSGSDVSLWENWKDPVSLAVLFYTALSSGAISDILQQKAQAVVPAAESNVLLSLEPVFSALLGLCLLAEIPSLREWIGGGFIGIASVLAST